MGITGPFERRSTATLIHGGVLFYVLFVMASSRKQTGESTESTDVDGTYNMKDSV